MTRLKKMILWGLLLVLAIIASGWLLADHLTPRAVGAPSTALPVQAAQTVLDRELLPILQRHPGQSGVLLINDGIEAFAARAMSARQAGRSLDLQYYIWHDDLAGRLLGREVWAAAERGVRVRMLLDDINASGKDAEFLALDAHPNIEIRIFNPFRNRAGPMRVVEMLQRGLSLNHRMHNKAWIADGRVAIVGGRNIGEEYFNASAQSNFRDLDALLFGPVVDQASTIFDQFWNSDAAVPIAALNQKSPQEMQTLLARMQQDLDVPAARAYLSRVANDPRVQDYLSGSLTPHWSDQLEVVSDPPHKRRREAHDDWLVDVLERRLDQARKQAWLISPYFVPGQGFTDKMVAGEKNGLDVRVVTNSLAANDVLAVHAGYKGYRKQLLAGGVQIYELRSQPSSGDKALLANSGGGLAAVAGSGSGANGSSNASLHTKAFVIDGEQGFIGSFNLDPRSAYLNTEMGLLFRDPEIAKELGDEFLRLAGPGPSYQVSLDDDGKLAWHDRSTRPATVLDNEPDSSWSQRALATVLGWLPIESQL